MAMDFKRNRIKQLDFDFFRQARAKGIPVTGELLKAMAMEFALLLRIEGFKASNGWLGSWKGRYNVKQYKRCEGVDVDEEVVEDYRSRIQSIISGKNKQRCLIVMKRDCSIMPCQTKPWQRREMQ